MEVKAHKI